MTRRELVYPSVIEYLKKHKGKHVYEEVAKALGTHPKGIGSSMRAICRQGLHKYCRRVVGKSSGKPLYDCPE